MKSEPFLPGDYRILPTLTQWLGDIIKNCSVIVTDDEKNKLLESMNTDENKKILEQFFDETPSENLF